MTTKNLIVMCCLISVVFTAPILNTTNTPSTQNVKQREDDDSLMGENSLDLVELEQVVYLEGGEPIIVDYEYVAIIDAGSSHTDIYIYNWITTKMNGTGDVVQKGKLVCQPVLSNFERNPEAAGPSLDDCLNYALENIPKSQHNNTRILLGATAGMRVLASKNPSAAAAIFQSIRDFIRQKYPFIIRDDEIGILSTEKEGGFAWVSINFVKGILKENANFDESARHPTWGSLDVGGASTQFSTEVTNVTNLRPSFSVRVFGHDYKVYTKSFLCYGKNEAFRRYKARLIQSQNFSHPVVDPCRPSGFRTTVEYTTHFERPCSNNSLQILGPHYKEKYEIIGSGNGTGCHEIVQDLFRFSMDLQLPTECPFQDGDCSFAQAKKGGIRGKFLGTGALFYDTKNLRILTNESYSLNPFDASGYRHARNSFCAKSHDQVEDLISSKPELKNFFLRQCFDATYIEVLLSHVYGLDDETLSQMVFAKNIDGVDVGWSLGWAISVSSEASSEERSS